MCRPRATLYTKAQVAYLMDAWKCTEPIPGKGKKLVVCFPPSFECDLVEVEATPLKSDSGERLWRVTSSSRAGREFDAVVQESHVQAYRMHRAEEHRRANLARHERALAL